MQIPHSTKQRIISAEHGILVQERGISLANTEIIGILLCCRIRRRYWSPAGVSARASGRESAGCSHAAALVLGRIIGDSSALTKTRYAAIAMIVLYAFAVYFAIGFASAVAFVTVGATQVTHSSLTTGARILLLPAATIFWPYVLRRWLKSRGIP